MPWFDKLIRRSAKTMSETVSDTVKQELKVVTNNFLPVLGLIGLGFLGWQMFKRSTMPNPIPGQSSITNNYFFGEDGKEIMQQLLEERTRRIRQ